MGTKVIDVYNIDKGRCISGRKPQGEITPAPKTPPKVMSSSGTQTSNDKIIPTGD